MMGRELALRLRITGKLEAKTGLHVGGAEEDISTDLPLARDGRGEWYVPGTSLAGVLRTWCRRAFGRTATDELWGFQEDDRGGASGVLVEDVYVQLPEGSRDALRDGVGIDREFGSAAQYIKYDRAVLPAGTLLSLKMTVELPKDGVSAQRAAMIGHLLQALNDGQVKLGAARTRGLGVVQLRDLAIREERLDQRDGIIAILEQPAVRSETSVNPSTLIQRAPGLQPKTPNLVSVTVKWRPIGPLMVRAGSSGMAVDSSLPLMEHGPTGLTLVLPGSSVKGALRSQAERIVRTVLDAKRSWPDPDDLKRFQEQVAEPLVTWLFGERAKDENSNPAGGGPAGIRPGRGALAIPDCYAEQVVAPGAWRRIAIESSVEEVRKALDNQGLQCWTPAFHVAVDRWTGGAATGLLFSALEPHAVAWEPIGLEVDLERIPRDLQKPAFALLLLLLDDLAEGRMPLGFATNRGFGAVQVDECHLDATQPAAIGLVPEQMPLTEQGSLLEALQPSSREGLKEAWQAWWSAEVKGAGAHGDA